MSHSSRLPFALLLACLMGAVLILTGTPGRPAEAAPDAGGAASCWTGAWEHFPRFGLMWLSGSGTAVSGSYEWDWGRLSGTLNGDTLRGQWSEWPTYAPPVDAGNFVFTISADCATFTGSYNYGSEDEWQDWTGTRVDAPGRVSMTVEEPTVTYAGQEYAPGQTFFPEACDTSSRAAGAEPCETPITLEKLLANEAAAALIGGCVQKRIQNVIFIIERAGLDEIDRDLVLSIATSRALEKCLTGTERESAQLDLQLTEGAGLFASVAAGLTLTVDAQLATATASEPGSFLAGYDPQTNEAVFSALSAALSVTPVGGSTLVLPPYHAVGLTPEGFGPVNELPRLYVPVVVAPASGS